MSRLQQAVCGGIKALPAICQGFSFSRAGNCYVLMNHVRSQSFGFHKPDGDPGREGQTL